MAKQRYVNTHFWDDTFIRTLPAGDKLLFLYLITNPCTNIAGAYEITIDRMNFDTGMGEKRVVEALKRLEEADKLTYRDGWICMHNFIKNQSLGEKIQTGIIEAVKRCPDWIKDSIYIRYHTLCIGLDIFNPNSNSNSNPKRKKNASYDARVVSIFEEWKTVLNKKSSLDAKRHKTIMAALGHFSVEDLKLVPYGALKSPWHIGDNPAKKKYLEISTLYRDAEQIEKFIDLAKQNQVIVQTVNARTQSEKEATFAAQAKPLLVTAIRTLQ